jgi:hypothetical protein
MQNGRKEKKENTDRAITEVVMGGTQAGVAWVTLLFGA